MYTAIYQVYDWNTVEPMTFIFQAWWLMIGSGFYLRHKTNFTWDSGYDYFKKIELDRLVKQNNFDIEKKEFLESYITELERYLTVLDE